jgi:post-segregation antitoxin (ccd killing protein)
MRSGGLAKRTELVATEPVDALIRVVRGQRVIVDGDLARLSKAIQVMISRAAPARY